MFLQWMRVGSRSQLGPGYFRGLQIATVREGEALGISSYDISKIPNAVEQWFRFFVGFAPHFRSLLKQTTYYH